MLIGKRRASIVRPPPFAARRMGHPHPFVRSVCLCGIAIVVGGMACDRSDPPAPNSTEQAAERTNVVDVAAKPESTAPAKSLPAPRYAGTARCKSCHEEVHAAWAQSHHALAERPIDEQQDRAAFVPDQQIVHGSVRSTVRQRDGRFEIETLGGDGTMQTFVPTRVIGEAPLRQYLIPAGGGRLQVSGIAFDTERGDWFDVFGNEDRRPHEWGFWANRGMNWNAQCAACHNTGLRKGYDPTTDAYNTTFAEMGVGCEACHGPSSTHVEWQREHLNQANDPTAPRIPAGTTMALCGSCHARRVALTDGYRVGDAFLDHFRPALPDHTDTFHPDGQIRDEVFEYTSFILSRMHFKGVQCVDCHVEGTTRLAAKGNDLCLRCHGRQPDPKWKLPHQLDPATHSHHDPNQAGGQCVSCHMPVTVYMQRDPRHDHGLTIPDPLLTREYGIPNACNRCHTDKSVDWAIEATQRWYGEKMNRVTRRRTRILARARQGDESVLGALTDLARTEEVHAWRAVIARMLGRWSHRPEVARALLPMLTDDDALVRVEAVGALEPIAESVGPALVPRLEDPVRAVRVQAGWALRRQLAMETRAGRDLEAYFAENADQPTGAVMLGTFHRDRGRPDLAVDAFRQAVKFEPAGAPQRHALAVALSHTALQAEQAGSADQVSLYRREAIDQLQIACRLAPRDAEMAHALGLAFAEVDRVSNAIEWLERACAIDPSFERAAYNLGLAYDQVGQAEKAAASLRRAASLAPDRAEYPYALATVLVKLGQAEAASEAARQALAIDPRHTPAAQLLQQMSGSGR